MRKSIAMLRAVLASALITIVLSLPAVAGEARVLHEAKSPYNTIIVTEEPDGIRNLLFERNGARQTAVRPDDPGYLHLSYSRVAMAGLALCNAPESILIFGLGGGAIAMFLRTHFPDATIDVVDIDPEVVNAAKRYFGFREDARMRAHVSDAREFAEKAAKGRYDVIFLDAFGRDTVPAHLTTVEFLRTVRAALKPDGVAIGNIWSRENNRLYDAMIRTYQEAFDDLYIVHPDGAGNRLLLSLPRRVDLSERDLVLKARQFSSRNRFRFDLGDLVHGHFSRDIEKDARQPVLRDQPAVYRQRSLLDVPRSAEGAQRLTAN